MNPAAASAPDRRAVNFTAIRILDMFPPDLLAPDDLLPDAEFDSVFLLSGLLAGGAGVGPPGGGGFPFPAALFRPAARPRSDRPRGCRQPPPFSLPPPAPVTTAAFPDGRGAGRRPGRGQKRPRKGPACCICLEPLWSGDRRQLRLPCGHRFHNPCAYNLLTAGSLGAESMLRCPLCRRTVDRYDLRAVPGGPCVGPAALRGVSRRCASFRALPLGSFAGAGAAAAAPVAEVVARLVQDCIATRASDGFVYNCCLLAIDRALFHRSNLIRVMDAQLRDACAGAPARGGALDVAAFVETTVACHLEVLMRTATAPADEE